jgi:transposase
LRKALQRAAAARFAVSAAAAIKLVRQVRQTGSTAPARIGGYRKPLLAGQEGFLRELTARRKGITLAEIRAALIERGVAPVSLMTIWSMLKRLGQTHKKVAEGGRAGPARCGRAPPPLAHLAALHGPGAVCISR